MDFGLTVKNLLWESPDALNYQGKELTFSGDEGNPHTFFIAKVSVRIDARKGYKADVDSPFGMCVVYGPSRTTASPGDDVRVNFYEDTDVPELTHANLGSFLIYNTKYSYDDLKKFGIGLYSAKKDVDGYFNGLKDVYKNITFTLTDEQLDIGLKWRGRFWFVDGKAIVSLWYFDKDNCMKYLIPFFKNKFGITEENIIFEVATAEENESKAGGTDKFVSGSALEGKEITEKPYEKELNALLARLHSAPTGEKEKVKAQLLELMAKHKLDPKKYGLSDETPKASDYFSQKVLGKSKETIASLKAKQQTSESLTTN
jgi:hypothetical protein